MSKCQVLIADFYYIPIGKVKKLVPNFCDKKNMCFIIKTWIKAKKNIHCVLEFNQSQIETLC